MAKSIPPPIIPIPVITAVSKQSVPKQRVKKIVARKKKNSPAQKRKKIRALKAMVKTRRRRRARSIFGYRWSRPSNSLIIDYLEYNGRLPKIDAFTKLKPGALVKVLQNIDGKTAKPKSRDGVKDYYYLMKILVELPKGTHLMFLERHSKFPEWYKFLVLGGRNVWIDISDYVDFLSIMRKPVSKKKTPC